VLKILMQFSHENHGKVRKEINIIVHPGFF
jgi:hypothetical protein